jgi:hypothetical protein
MFIDNDFPAWRSRAGNFRNLLPVLRAFGAARSTRQNFVNPNNV